MMHCNFGPCEWNHKILAEKAAFFYHVVGMIHPIAERSQSDQIAYPLFFFFSVEFSFKVFPAKMNDVTVF